MNFASLLKSQRHQVEYVAMAPLLQLLSLFVLLSLCHSELNGGPRDSVCRSSNEGFIPGHGHGKRPNLDEEKYKVTISLIREKDNQTVDCVENSTRYIVRINATKYFKGFIITSTEPGMGYPANFVGKFRRTVNTYSDEHLLVACENTISHSNILKSNPVNLKWRTSASAREVEFLYAIVFSRFVWAANLTTRFPICKPAPTPECVSRVEPEASGSGTLNVTTDIPGSALSESTCKLVHKRLTKDLYIPVEAKSYHFKCATESRVKQCEGKCTYCNQGCQAVQSRTIKRTYECVTDDPDPYLFQKVIKSRGEVQEHLKCDCIGKNDSEVKPT